VSESNKTLSSIKNQFIVIHTRDNIMIPNFRRKRVLKLHLCFLYLRTFTILRRKAFCILYQIIQQQYVWKFLAVVLISSPSFFTGERCIIRIFDLLAQSWILTILGPKNKVDDCLLTLMCKSLVCCLQEVKEVVTYECRL
jgi:hypothetical protein